MAEIAKLKDSPVRRASKPRAVPDPAVLAINDGGARDVIARLARVEGQIRAIHRMIDERRDCHAIVQQLGAARTALERATAQLMVSSLAHASARRRAETRRPTSRN